jgi:hypothetical protein
LYVPFACSQYAKRFIIQSASDRPKPTTGKETRDHMACIPQSPLGRSRRNRFHYHPKSAMVEFVEGVKRTCGSSMLAGSLGCHWLLTSPPGQPPQTIPWIIDRRTIIALGAHAPAQDLVSAEGGAAQLLHAIEIFFPNLPCAVGPE